MDLVSNADWGDVPTWLATVGAFIAVLYAARAWRIERKREEHAASDRRAEQATKVAAWPDSSVEPARIESGVASYLTASKRGYTVRNASDLPVSGIMFVWRGAWEHEWDVTETGPREIHGQGLIKPGENIFHAVDDTDDYRLTFEFSDAAGNTWHRTFSSALHEGRSMLCDICAWKNGEWDGHATSMTSPGEQWAHRIARQPRSD